MQVLRRNRDDVFTDDQEKDLTAKLRLNSNFFRNNFVKASWIPTEFMTDLRNWHSPMIREWTYKGHTRVGQPVGLQQCLPRKYSFVDIYRTSKNAVCLPPSFHRMPDLSVDHVNKSKNLANRKLRDLVRFAENHLQSDGKALNLSAETPLAPSLKTALIDNVKRKRYLRRDSLAFTFMKRNSRMRSYSRLAKSSSFSELK